MKFMHQMESLIRSENIGYIVICYGFLINFFRAKQKTLFLRKGGRHIFLTAITLITINLLTETCKIKKRLKLYSKRYVILKKNSDTKLGEN